MGRVSPLVSLLVSTGLLFLPLCFASENQWVAVSSAIEICGFTCNQYGVYQLDRVPPAPILEFICPDKSARAFVRIYDPYNERVLVNETSGCCLIGNAQRSDTGDYALEWSGKDNWIRTTTCRVMDPVSVSNITTNRSGETVSVSVSYSGEEATVQWTWNGGALPERHQLSDSNKTLTVPSTDTGTFTVLVSNPVSRSSTEYNVTLPAKESESQSKTGMIVGILFGFLLFFVTCGMVYWIATRKKQKTNRCQYPKGMCWKWQSCESVI
ncbi:uncharacterized protein LOC108700345 [Xenopus laevis]|uniref:Uncharacterized protein LOC108700345 n=2 Tax=Xenopus laevis TaxID=8355 RepID=A0A1L8F4I2_XENLA|nr:uncharacterized protein LOC108700345 [Xenopus laevis]OCT66490.1 hypothetical protein XELAEV_18042740mg [Xenopus laevis]